MTAQLFGTMQALEDNVKEKKYSALEYRKFRFHREDTQEQVQQKNSSTYLQFMKPDSDQFKTFLDPLEATVNNTIYH